MDTRSSKRALVWGSLLIVLGGILLADRFFELSVWVWVATFALSGVGILAIYFTDISQRWILIPTYILFVFAGFLALIEVDFLRGEYVATFILTIIALPFLYVFLRDSKQWWALIPAYILIAIGVMVGLIAEGILNDLLIPAYVLLSIALPFFVVYVRDTKQWWALIPGGIIGLIGFSFLLAEGAFQYVIPVLVILAGAWIVIRQFIHREAPSGEIQTSIPMDTDETAPE